MPFKKNSYSLFLLSFAFLNLLFNACNQNSSKTSSNATETKTKENTNKQKEIEAIYQDCTVYAGSTVFLFKTMQGDTIQVSILNKGMEDAETSAKVPENLVDNSKDLEGPPGANPKMVGKKFKIIYNHKEEVIEVQFLDKF